MKTFSRREFVAMTAAGAVITPFVGTRALTAVTAQDIVDRIKKNIGVDWSSDDVDTFKIGDPATIVTGVVTTSMATLDVLQKAVQAGANFVITAAPTFYTRADLSAPAGRGPGPGAAGAGRGPASGRGAPPGAPAAPPPSPSTVSGPGTGASAPMPAAPTLPSSVVPPPQPPAAAGPTPAAPPPDPVYAGKNDFIAKHRLVIFRLTQHWNQRKPDPRAQGLAAAMGWTKY